MEVICSICRCPISKNPPEGSTDLADMCEEMQTPDPVELPKNDNAPNIVSTPCGHLFHNSCLTQWYMMIGNRRCPLCNYVTPVHRMIRVFLTMDKKAEENCCDEEEEGRPAESQPVTAEGDKGGTDVDVDLVVEAQDFPRQQNEERLEEEDTREPVPMQVTDTTRNRIRAMIYHFRPTASSSPEELLEIFPTRDSQQQQRARVRVPSLPTRRRDRSPRHCNGCANYSRIQALMTSDLQDLRDLVAEQSGQIESLEEQTNEPKGPAARRKSYCPTERPDGPGSSSVS